ncbi:class I SAM-dependent methyltransferase [Streptomyces roseolus]|uniref:class I SAM-dependent methyltransferase n=1 Tax=Streptomyces roseolus TaxID=67358 RepID=UPI0036F730A7
MDETTPHPRSLPAPRPAGRGLLLREAFRDRHATGAIAPSGRRLARALTDPVLSRPGQPLNILEAGAGTGAVTRTLLPALAPGSRLDIVEANPRFTPALRDLTEAASHTTSPAPRIQVHTVRVERLNTGVRYDTIISGLPFTNFEPEQVTEIMDRYLELLHPGGTLTYFAYLGTRHARLLAGRTAARRHRAVEKTLADYHHRYAIGRWTVLRNLPPAHIWQLALPANTTPAPTAPATMRLTRPVLSPAGERK